VLRQGSISRVDFEPAEAYLAQQSACQSLGLRTVCRIAGSENPVGQQNSGSPLAPPQPWFAPALDDAEHVAGRMFNGPWLDAAIWASVCLSSGRLRQSALSTARTRAGLVWVMWWMVSSSTPSLRSIGRKLSIRCR